MLITNQTPLAPLTSFQIGGAAGTLVTITNQDELRAAADHALQEDQTPVILGGGTNTLLPDSTLPLVWRLTTTTPVYTRVDTETIIIWAGTPTAALAWSLIRAGLGGLERFTTLPGTLGGAVWGNAHAGGQLIGDHVTQIEVLDTQTLKTSIFTHDQLDFAYDYSKLQTQPTLVITQIWCRVTPDQDPEKLAQTARTLLTRKKASQGAGQRSAGCFWQNPPNTPELRLQFPQFAAHEYFPAGFLIDSLALPNDPASPVTCGPHRSFIINRGHATQAQVIAYAREIQGQVYAHYSIWLVPEVVIVRPNGTREKLPLDKTDIV